MKEFLDEIQRSFQLLTLKNDWDDEGAKPVNHKAYCRALEFLFKLVNSIGEIETPRISQMNDGSIDISFRGETVGKNIVRLLINVKENGIAWYGDVGNDNEINEKQTTDLFNEDLFYWIKVNLKK